MLRSTVNIMVIAMAMMFSSLKENETKNSYLEGYTLNSENGLPIPYANIAIVGTSKGTFANEKGYFKLKRESDDNLHLKISAIGFRTKEIVFSQSNRIYLTPDIIKLNEVIISSKKRSKVRQEFLGVRKGSICCYYSGFQPFYALKIVNPYKKQGTITKVRYKTVPSIYKNERHKFLARIRVYEFTKDGYPGKDLLNENVIIELGNNQKVIEVDIEKYNVSFPSTGAFIGIDFLGLLTYEGEADFTKRGSRGSIALTKQNNEANTYRRNFNEEWKNVSKRTQIQSKSWPDIVNALISAKVKFSE